jgi:oligopeptide transport system permease protein
MNVFSLFISFPIGIIAGTVAALKKDKFTDHMISFLIIIFISVPSFVIASLMQYLFTFIWPVFPTLYDPRVPLFSTAALYSLTLPIIALALGPIATLGRYLRSELIETMSSEFLLLARTKGLSHRQAIVRHAFRNSMVPLANFIIPMFTSIMFGSLIIETIYAIPGLGGILINSILLGDHPVTIASILFFSLIGLLTILVVDISYGFIDPRIRMGGRRIFN